MGEKVTGVKVVTMHHGHQHHNRRGGGSFHLARSPDFREAKLK